jgi:hypothetical protein
MQRVEPERYRQYRRCPKCRSGAVTTLFVADVDAPMLGFRRQALGSMWDSKDSAMVARLERQINEHVPTPRMQRDCVNCKHFWHELPLDVESSQVPSEVSE